MKCPRDGGELRDAQWEPTVVVHPCPGCQGIWATQSAVEVIERLHVNPVDVEASADEIAAAIARGNDANRAPGPCPACGTTLVVEEYGLASGVMVDRCPKGCGTWFDQGELAAIEAFVERSQHAASQGGWFGFVLELMGTRT
jgi:Zn-finger nucleic acid-binding protein